MQGQSTFIVTTDGVEYGPTDLNTLATWATSGRLKPQTIITEVQTGSRFAAAENPFLKTRLPAVVAPPPVFIASSGQSVTIEQEDESDADSTPPKNALILTMWGITILHYIIGATANGDPQTVFGAFALLGLPSTVIAIILVMSKNKTDRTNGIVKLVLMVFALFALVAVLAVVPPPPPQSAL